MTIFLRMLSYLIVLVLISYSLLRYYHLWTRNKIPNALYFVLHILLLAALIVCQRRVTWITQPILLITLQGISAIYLSVMIFTPVLCFLRGIIRFVGNRMKKHGQVYRFFNHPARSIYCFLILTILIGGFAFFRMKYISTTEYSLQSEKQCANESLKIALISDVHLGSSVSRNGFQKIIQKTNDAKPDLILLCGDFIDSNTSDELRSSLTELLKNFKSQYGTFFVEGNQEARISHYEKLFENSGVQLLRDQTIYLSNGIQLVGLRDEANKDKIPVKNVLQGLNKEKPTIIVSHRPIELEELSQAGADLALCGHTLGGQYPLSSLVLGVLNDMVYGQQTFDKMNAITTSGAGGYGIPVKYTSKSEIVFINLTFSSAEQNS